jgi:hypothetical protein
MSCLRTSKASIANTNQYRARINLFDKRAASFGAALLCAWLYTTEFVWGLISHYLLNSLATIAPFKFNKAFSWYLGLVFVF